MDTGTELLTNEERRLCEWAIGASIPEFDRKLIELVSIADIKQLTELSESYPRLVDAFGEYKKQTPTWKKLIKQFEEMYIKIEDNKVDMKQKYNEV